MGLQGISGGLGEELGCSQLKIFIYATQTLAPGPSRLVQGCTRDAPKMHPGCTEDSPGVHQGCTSSNLHNDMVPRAFPEENYSTVEHLTVDRSALLLHALGTRPGKLTACMTIYCSAVLFCLSKGGSATVFVCKCRSQKKCQKQKAVSHQQQRNRKFTLIRRRSVPRNFCFLVNPTGLLSAKSDGTPVTAVVSA